MKWITREKVKVDRVACPWLVKNFIDPQAEFVFLPRETDWSKVRDGVVYDVPDCELGHHGEDVSFDSILKKYQLTDPALLLLADIVRAADSHPSNPHPAGEGLRWIASGFGVLGLSDHEILEREFVVYDALYAECKRRVKENHRWNTDKHRSVILSRKSFAGRKGFFFALLALFAASRRILGWTFTAKARSTRRKREGL